MAIGHDKCNNCDSEVSCKECAIFYLCECGSGENWEEQFDCYGIYLGRACSKCLEKFKSKYEPWVFSGYSQSDLDQHSGERIEPEEVW